MASEGYHEAVDALQPATVEQHRAIVSIMEELEAVDWYAQRVDASASPELAEILAHNRDEEKEHAAMTLEWLRRQDPVMDRHLRTYLFTEGSVIDIEDEATAQGGGDGPPPEGAAPANGDGSLGIGSLRHQEYSL